MTKRHIVIATRESPLALRQAEVIKQLLIEHHPELSVEFLGITTEADKQLDVNLITMGGKGWFVKELEEALLAKRADIAVHSMKDVPMELPPGLCLPVISEREDVRDVFISNHYATLAQLPQQAILGTSSLRRQTQIRALRNDLILNNLRGNIQTRLKKLDQGEFTGIILAAAGLKRMGLAARICEYIPTDNLLPAAGQGALGIECREDDTLIQKLIASLNHAKTFACVAAERAMCKKLGGGCQLPVAAFAHLQQDKLILNGLVASNNGLKIIHARRVSDISQAEMLGKRVAEELLEKGADKILKTFKSLQSDQYQ